MVNPTDRPQMLPELTHYLAREIEWLNRTHEMPSWMPPFSDQTKDNFLEELMKWKRTVEERRPPPSPLRPDDESNVRVGAFIDEVRAAPHAMRQAVAGSLQHEASGGLASFAASASTLAVRMNEPTYLPRAVVALGFAYVASQDWRDVLVCYPLPYDAARRLGLDPDALFLDGAMYVRAEGATSLRDFTNRSERNKSLEVMGYRAGEDADGFRYVRDRWRPPKPVT